MCSPLALCKQSARKNEESLELQLLPDNPFDLLKKAENIFNASTNYQPFQQSVCNLQLEEHQKAGLGWIPVIEGDECCDLPSLTTEERNWVQKTLLERERSMRTHESPPLQEQ